MVNTPVLEQVLTFLKDHPELHDQNQWCGTAQCLAGWTVAIAEERKLTANDTRFDPDPVRYPEEVNWPTDYVHISDRARHILGLNREDGDSLFAGNNKLEDLEVMVNAAANGQRIPTLARPDLSLDDERRYDWGTE